MDAPSEFGDWQTALNKCLSKLENQNSFSNFKRLVTNIDRVDFIINQGLLRNVEWLQLYFEASGQWHRKSETEGQLWKNKGNRLFQQRKYVESALYYTQCCIHSPTNGCDLLAVGYGNRSAALYHLGNYQDCITDVDRAILQGAPETSKPKLWLRKISALVKLGQKTLARQELDKLKDFMSCNEFSLTGGRRDAFEGEVILAETNVDKAVERKANMKPATERPAIYRGTNDIVTQASKAVTLKDCLEKTRHLVANENIPQGSSIIVEKPFSAILLPDQYDSHCHHCFSPLPLTAIGCDTCCQVQFCGEACRDSAFEKYHRTECRYLDLLHSVGIAHLSFRTILLAGNDFLKEFLSERKEHRSSNAANSHMKGLNSEGVYGHNYLTVFDLMTHEDTTLPQDMLQYSMTAALLLCTLIHAGHFDGLASDNNAVAFNKDAILQEHFLGQPSSTCDSKCESERHSSRIPTFVKDVGSLLLRHILQLICNAHAITALKSTTASPGENDLSPGSLVDTQEQVRIATAIYPSASLMNHSCDPTIVSSFIGDLLAVKTVKNVAKGEEIFNCYGPHSRRMKREERQEVLESQYHFKCRCPACLSDGVWQQRFGAYKCSSCSDILSHNLCVGCGRTESADYLAWCETVAKETNSQFSAALEAMKKDNREALKLLLKCQEQRQTIFYKDHRNLAFGEDAIARCYANLGDFSSSADHLYASVEFASLMYGAHSAEFGHELQKLAEVLFNAERFTECREMSARASQLLGNLYTSGHQTLQQINDLNLAAETALNPMMKAY